ncbi:MAG: alpha/beta hydrolase [Candidatus Sumerlaeota bacterium]|nr:alpha/beta hydrolase [Candidatus Sumerlaeota bacterium]
MKANRVRKATMEARHHDSRKSGWRRCCLLAAGLLWGAAFSAAIAQREPTGEQLQTLLRRFPDADANQDGRLSAEELRQLRLKTRGNGAAAGLSRPAAKSPTASTLAKTETRSAAVSASSPAGAVTVEVSTDKPIPVNPNVYGINCEEMFMKDLVDEPEYIAALTELKLKSFLYPGGSITYYHHPQGSGGFNIRPEEVRRSKQGEQSRFMNQNAGPDHFEQYIQFVKASGGASIFVANILNGTVDEMDEFLRRLKAAGVPIECVVLGVEMHLGQPRELGLDGYIERIKPYIETLRAKYPDIPILPHSTPVGRLGEGAPAAFHEWNQKLAALPGISGFSQYAFAELGYAPGTRELVVGPNALPPADRWRRYEEFVRAFAAQQIPAYQKDWGPDKKMYLTQWGTQAEQNTPVQGLHVANFYFFLAQYNAAHDNYIASATSALLLAQKPSATSRRHGVVYQSKIELLAPYLYTKPFRHLFSGDKKLLAASVKQLSGNGAEPSVKALAASGPDGRGYVYVLNSGPRVSLGQLVVDGRAPPADLTVQVESVFCDSASDSEDGATSPIKTFTGEIALRDLALEPWSLTVLITPATALARERRTPRRKDSQQPERRSTAVPETVTLLTDIAYREGSEAWRLDLAMPKEQSEQPRPAIVFLHGGGWRSGDKSILRPLALEYATKGYVGAAVNYRLVDDAPFPACVEDVKCAVRWLRANAARFQVDPERIGAYGNSAGAHLAALLGLAGREAGLEGDGPFQEQSSLVQAVCCSATPTDFTDWGGRGFPGESVFFAGPAESLADQRKKASPITYVRSDAPPFLVIHGKSDTTVPFSQAERFVNALNKVGAKDVAFEAFDGAAHGVFAQKSGETRPLMEAFFARTLKAFDPKRQE